MERIKVITIVGTRPEIIRLSAVIQKLDKYTQHVLVHTGQNYDFELYEVFFKDLELKKPNYCLNAKGSSLGETLSNILSRIEPILIRERPDAVLILGDTNSSLTGIMAKRLKIPLFHMEAGNRCFDFNVPEEINRQIIDHISDVNLPYSENARLYLLREGIPEDRIFVIGSPMGEVLDRYHEKIEKSNILKELRLKNGGYFVVSMHREENVDNVYHLESLLATLNAISMIYKIPVIVSTHPRTRKRLENMKAQMNRLIRFCKPFGFTDYVKLQVNAKCVISDSGTISEESAILGFPAITIRESIERPEAVDAGSIVLAGVNKMNILASLEIILDNYQPYCPEAYRVRNTSDRVLNIIVGYIQYINKRVWFKGIT